MEDINHQSSILLYIPYSLKWLKYGDVEKHGVLRVIKLIVVAINEEKRERNKEERERIRYVMINVDKIFDDIHLEGETG